jgi:hypothetical protein
LLPFYFKGKNMRVIFGFTLLLSVALVTSSCGRVESAAQTVSNDAKLPGHWLQDNNSLVLTFKDGKAAYSPVSGFKGKVADLFKSACEQGPRSYRVDGNQIIYAAEGPNCPQVAVTIQKVTEKNLEIPSLSDPKTILKFAVMNDADFNAKVDEKDRQPK